MTQLQPPVKEELTVNPDGEVNTKHVIDKGEALLAVTGIRRVIDRDMTPIDATKLRESRSLYKQCRDLAKSLVLDELGPPAMTGTGSYRKLLDELTQPLDVDAMHDLVRSGDTSLAYVTAASNAYSYLQAKQPKSLFNSQVSTTNLEPSVVELWTFDETFDLIDNPLSVFNRIATGEIVLSQVECIRTCFPTLATAIDECLQDAITDQLVKSKNFELPVSVEFGVATWRGKPVTSVPWQNAYNIPAAVRQPSPSEAKSPLAQESESNTEQSLYKAAGLK